jgi:hypothetical protein
MMTVEELQKSNVNAEVAKEALAQSEKLLIDVLDTKKSLEQKATTLFGTFVTIALALFGIGGALIRDNQFHQTAYAFFIAGAFFVCGAAIFVNALKPAEYGNLGSEPSMWLVSGRIDGKADALARMFAYVTHYHSRRIEISEQSNGSKRRSLNRGMWSGVTGSLALCLGLIYLAWAVRL